MPPMCSYRADQHAPLVYCGPTWGHPHKSVGQPTPRFWPFCGMVWAQNGHHHMPASYPQDSHNVDLGLPTGIHVTHISCQYSTGLPTQVQMCSTTHFTLVHESIISKKQWTAQYRLHTGNQHGGLREVTLLWYISKLMLLSLSLEYLPCKYIVYCWVLCSVRWPFFSFI